jgi:tRNA1Val (adenine37-N6)-methyltransferase
MSSAFRFKKFTVSDAGCGMKLGTDAVLLGAYATPPAYGNILDVGCGCGILSLMMAQQSPAATITAIDIDEDACRQAVVNFDASAWSGRLKAQHSSFQDFYSSTPLRFDCIISNPPYFQNQLNSPDEKRNTARHTLELSYDDLCTGVAQLLDESGEFWVILPAALQSGFLVASMQNGLYCMKILSIYDKPEKKPGRKVFCLSKNIDRRTETEEIVIRDIRNQFTGEYIDLTGEYYLG